MEAVAKLNNCPMSPRKMRLVVDQIRGQRVEDALNTLKYSQKRVYANGLDFIFDKSGDLLMLVSNSKYDRSDEVLEELGVVSTSSEKGSNLPPQ